MSSNTFRTISKDERIITLINEQAALQSVFYRHLLTVSSGLLAILVAFTPLSHAPPVGLAQDLLLALWVLLGVWRAFIILCHG